MNDQDSKRLSRERFGRYAAGYAQSDVFFRADELPRLVELAEPHPHWRMLDIAAGGGATALAFSPHVAQVIALDLAEPMLAAARTRIASGAPNAAFTAGDAEQLPFASAAFDLITCRIAPHHFPNVFAFMQEVARCLKPGGVLALQDLTVPDDERAARFIDSFERLRDPSHHRMYAEYEWRGLCLDVGLTVEAAEIHRRGANMPEWAQMQGCSEATIQHLHVLMAQAPAAVRDWLNICCAGTPDAGFDHVYVLMRAVKPT